MNAPTPPPAADPWRPLRYLWRTPALVLHLVVVLPITLVLVALPLARRRWRTGETIEHRLIRLWSAMLMRIFGVHVRAVGAQNPGATLFVANHLSWLDIELLHSVRMMGFVAKAEIERWPFIGWLAKRGGTIYHRRGDPGSLANVQQVMVDRLRAGASVGVFPEGGTGPGDRVKTFHARIFQAAIEADVPAQPVALKFLRAGTLAPAIAFRAGENFLQNFFRVLGDPPTVAEVHFCEPVPPQRDGRRRMAEAARARIVAALGVPDRRRDSPTDELDPLAESDVAG